MSEPLVFPLRHGILLTINGEPTLRSVRNFLTAAVVHFKNQRDIQKPELYSAGSFQGRLGVADGAISFPGDTTGQYLPADLWTDAVLGAYRRVAALDDIVEKRDTPQGPAGGGSSKALLALLEQPSPKSHLAALALVMLTSWDDDPFADLGEDSAASDTVH